MAPADGGSSASGRGPTARAWRPAAVSPSRVSHIDWTLELTGFSPSFPGIGWYGPRSISFSLSDGSHHIIGMPEESSDLAGAVYDLPLSRYLTTQARELFLTTERPMELVYHPLEQAGVRIAGCCRLDGYWAWLQQCVYLDLTHKTFAG